VPAPAATPAPGPVPVHAPADTRVSAGPAVPRPTPPTAPQPAPPPARRFGDHAAARDALYAGALAATRSAFPVENSRYRLDATDLGYAGAERFGPAEEKAARLSGRTLARRLTGVVSLTDKASGQTVDVRRTTLAHVPYLTDHGVFVLNGSPAVLAHQLRLDPGVYVRRKGSDEVEAHVNVLPGAGASHRIRLEPHSGVLKVDAGQAEIPALPLLRALGASDGELDRIMGRQLRLANEKAAKPHHLEALWEKLGPGGPKPPPEELAAALAAHVSKAPLDPWVLKRTLGVSADRYGKDVALAAVDKVLKVHRGQAEPDDRDSLAYSTLRGPEHLVSERLARSGSLLQKLLWQVTNRGSLAPLQPGFLSPAVRSVFLKSGLAQSPEGANALEFIDHGSRVTKVGEGGLGRTADAVPESSRNVSPSHFGFLDAIRTSESESVGVDLRTAFGTRLGHDGRIHAPVKDVKSGKLVYRSPRDLADAVLAFPGWYHKGRPVVPAIVGGKLDYVPREKVDYVVPSMEQSFNPLTSLVVAKSAAKPHRASMGARMVTQALPLVNREAPLVRTGVPGQPGKSYEELFGRHAGAVFAHDAPGVVESVAPGGVRVRYADGRVETHDLYDHHPAGRSTMLHNLPVVRPGQSIAPGQILAASNNTDDEGHAAYGVNARVGLVPFLKGPRSTYEDAIVVAESLAKRMTSEHLYPHAFEPDEHTTASKAAYAAAFPGRHPLKLYDNYDERGVVKPGTVVQPDEPLVMAIRRDPGGRGILRSRRAGIRDASVVWDHDTPGEVIDVVPTRGGHAVTVKTHRPLMDGDKVAGLHGNKGVATIVPDDEMPHDESGRPLEAAFSSLGITSRTNPAALVAMALGKAAAHRGRGYTLFDFTDVDHLARHAKDELARHGLKDKETLTDPTTGRTAPGVTVGNLYLMKLSHTAAKKVKGRGVGAYDESGTPTRGEGGASRMSMGDTMALLSHGSLNMLRDLKLYRGQDNPEFWAAYMAGHPPPRPTVSHQFTHFLESLRGAGVDPVPEGHRVRMTALTAGRVRELAGSRVLKNAETVDLATGRPVPGGLFDPHVFGAEDSPTSWARIALAEPVVNPVFEEPVRKLLGLTEREYRDVVAGRGKLPGGKTGPHGLAEALRGFDVEAETAKARAEFDTSRRTRRDAAARRLRYLKGLSRAGQTPADWVLTDVPVLPPALRPVRMLAGGRGGVVVADPNLLYKEVLEADKGLRSLAGKVGDLGDERLAVYDAVKGAMGLGDPTDPRNVTRQVRGVLREIFPGSAKHSTVQQKLLGTPANLSGRGQVIPNADLDMDQIGLPERLAWEVFSPSVVRRLARDGYPRAEAVREVEARSERARKALLSEMTERPVTATRYPVLHRYNTMAFRPVLVAGDAIHTNPVINKAYALDHDGDTMTVHAPLFDEAVREAIDRMLPSKNLRSQGTFKADLYLPNMEFVQGLYHASTAKSDRPARTFRTRADAAAAYARGELTMADVVEILEN
jgi:DNA-directed RNA polymerase subunit beta